VQNYAYLQEEQTMPRAIWNGAVLAESDQTKMVEGNHYFPPQSIDCSYFKASAKQTTCGWKGGARYYTLEVNGETNPDAVWYYPETKDAARHIEGYVAFGPGVQIEP
jgi:uncharacterized protein (DUF427 family)